MEKRANKKSPLGVTSRQRDNGEKIAWEGVLVSVQPRIRLTRSFDQRSHTYLGYSLTVRGTVGTEAREFLVGVGQATHAKHQFRAGDGVSGEAQPVADSRLETAEFYKANNLKITSPAAGDEPPPPPWRGLAPPLLIYRERGHRRLAERTYREKCRTCIWGCSMPVEMIIDQWNPSERRYRTETFCYGPLSCALYQAGPERKVPGRKGMTYTEKDWVDADATSHRGVDE